MADLLLDGAGARRLRGRPWPRARAAWPEPGRLRRSTLSRMPGGGLEPPCPCGQPVLSRPCLTNSTTRAAALAERIQPRPRLDERRNSLPPREFQCATGGTLSPTAWKSQALRYSGAVGCRGPTPLLRLQSDERLVALTRRGNQAAYEALVARYQARLLAVLPPHARLARGRRGRAAGGLRRRVQRDAGRRPADQRAAVAVPDRAQPLPEPPAPHAGHRGRLDGRPPRPSTARPPPTRSTTARTSASSSPTSRTLPETQRTALLLREIDALCYEQIAEAMETTVPRVKSLLVRARVSLAEAAEARRLTCDEVRDELGEVGRGPAPASARRSAATCAAASAAAPSASSCARPTRRWPPSSRSGRCCCSRSSLLAQRRPTRRRRRRAARRPPAAATAGGGRRGRRAVGRRRRGRHEGRRRAGRRGDRHGRRGRGRPRPAPPPPALAPRPRHAVRTPPRRASSPPARRCPRRPRRRSPSAPRRRSPRSAAKPGDATPGPPRSALQHRSRPRPRHADRRERVGDRPLHHRRRPARRRATTTRACPTQPSAGGHDDASRPSTDHRDHAGAGRPTPPPGRHDARASPRSDDAAAGRHSPPVPPRRRPPPAAPAPRRRRHVHGAADRRRRRATAPAARRRSSSKLPADSDARRTAYGRSVPKRNERKRRLQPAVVGRRHRRGTIAGERGAVTEDVGALARGDVWAAAGRGAP